MRLRAIAAVAAAAGLAALIVLVPSSTSGSAAGAISAHTPIIVVTGSAGTVTTIQFEFPSSEPDDQSRTVIDVVRRALGTTARPGRAVVKNGVRSYKLDVNVASRQGFAESRISADVWQHIVAASHEPVVFDLRIGFHVVRGDVVKVEGGTTSRFDVTPDREVVYGLSAATVWGYALALIAAVVLGFAVLRPYARRVERRDGDPADRAHILQRLSMVGMLGMFAFVGVLLVTGLFWVVPVLVAGVFPRAAGWRWLMLASAALGIVVPFLVWALSIGLAIQPSYRRMRGIDGKSSRRNRIGFLAMGLGPIAFYSVARLVGGIFGPGGTIVAVALCFAFVLMIWPSLLVRILPTRVPSTELQARFRALCERQHTRVRGIRILEGKRKKTANAMLLGVGRFRYVLITDYLLDNLAADAIDAVILHEIAHAKQHHLIKKFATALAAIVVLEIVLAIVVDQFDLPAAIVSFGFVLGIPVSFVLVNGWLGMRLETKADDFAAEVVGPDALRRGLDCLAHLNMTKRRTGHGWDLLTQHPGIQQRVDRLTARESDSTPHMATFAKS